VADRDDVEVLAPLREKERELDDELARARAGAEERRQAAVGEAQSLRREAARSLAEEIDGLSHARSIAIETTRDARRAEMARRAAALREGAQARREEALALIMARVIGGAP